ncbi:MAG: precorrin-6A reductase [Moorellaceae bacterium]
MIVVLGGTSDGGEVIQALAERGYGVLATAVTPYGAELARKAGAAEVRQGELTAPLLRELLLSKKPLALIDATHPFAVEITALGRQVCTELSIPYFRYRREKALLPEDPRLTVVSSWEEAAAAAAAAQGKNVFLTIGTRKLEIFTRHPELKLKRLIVRVLPDKASLEKCLSLGFGPRDIIALYGPFSYELNLALYQQYGAQVLVTKNSGKEGGTEAKIRAALDLEMEVIVIEPPVEPWGMSLEEILSALSLRVDFSRPSRAARKP